MFSTKEILNKLLGCFEITLFMKTGINRFPPEKRDAIKSFLVPLLLAPPTLMILVLKSPGYPVGLLFALHGARIILVTVLFLFLMYHFSKHLDRKNGFFQFVSVGNWMNIPVFLLLIPILVVLLTGGTIEGSIESYAIVITLLSYILTGFVATHTLRIPWEMGGAIAVISMFINQTSLQMVIDLRNYLT